jgi:hypothetical protein
MHLIVLIHDRTGHNCLVGYRETDPDDSKKAWSTIHILLLSCHSNLCNWMRSSRVWMRSSRVWMRSSRVWMRSSRVWMRSSRVWMRSSRSQWLRAIRVVRASDSQCCSRKLTVLGSIPASSDTVESEGRQMQLCLLKGKVREKSHSHELGLHCASYTRTVQTEL